MTLLPVTRRTGPPPELRTTPLPPGLTPLPRGEMPPLETTPLPPGLTPLPRGEMPPMPPPELLRTMPVGPEPAPRPDMLLAPQRLGQWEAIVPIIGSFAGGLAKGYLGPSGGAGGYGPAGGLTATQVAEQRTVVTPVQTTAVTVQTGSGSIQTPQASIVPPVALPEEGVQVGQPPAARRPATVIEQTTTGLGAVPWWAWLAAGGVVLWALMAD